MMDKFCEYCGNTSGKEDSYGNCKSCGGKLTVRNNYPKLTPNEVRAYNGVSGSTSFIREYGREVVSFPSITHFKGVPINEIRGTLLDEYMAKTRGLFEIGKLKKLDFYSDYHG